jgi:hypothetical protein
VQGPPVGTHVEALSILAGDEALPAVQALGDIQRLAICPSWCVNRPEETAARGGAFTAGLSGHSMDHRREHQSLPPASTALLADLRCPISRVHRRVPVGMGELSQDLKVLSLSNLQ